MFFHKQKKIIRKVMYVITDYDDNIVKSFESDTDLKDYVDTHYTRIRARDNVDIAKDEMFFSHKYTYENDELVSDRSVFGEMFVNDDFLKSHGFVEVDDSELYNFAKDFGFRTLQIGNFGRAVHKEDLEKVKNIAQADYKPFVLKGSDWPYWFKVDGKLIKSRTSSWKNHIYTMYGYITEESLEEYNGPDKCKEHVNDSLQSS